MGDRTQASFGTCLLSVPLVCIACSLGEPALDPLDFVDPMIGTTQQGNTYPAVSMPFGLSKWTPQTRAGEHKGAKPFDYEDSRIQGMRWTNLFSGSAVPEYGSMTIMPVIGPLKVKPEIRASTFSHDEEVSTPYYYSVDLSTYGVRMECSTTTRTGYFRFTYPESDEAFVLVHPNNSPKAPHTVDGVAHVKILSDRQEIIGYNPVFRYYAGIDQSAGFSGFFVARFSKPFEAYGTWDQNGTRAGSVQASDEPGAYVRFETKPGETVEVKIGCSFVSIEKARKNLDEEIPHWDFEAVVQAARLQWHTALSKVEVSSRNDTLLTNFYTALYHSLLLPRVVGDADGAYVGFADDRSIHKTDDFSYYDDFSLWDTYRAEHPLLLLIQPDRVYDMINSLLAKSDQGGWLPIFPAWNSYTSEMIGDHAMSVIVDAYMKGFRDFDIEKAYRYMVRNASSQPREHADYSDGKGRRALRDYVELGYVPLDNRVEAFHGDEQVSRTLEYAYDDFCLARFAGALNREDDAAAMRKRAFNWHNVFDEETGFVRGRWRDGRWHEPFDPRVSASYITEATPWVYSWYVPHDIAGLVEAMGGRELFVEKLDRFFDGGFYAHDNEPSHHIAYLYSFAGAPWKTSDRVRDALRDNYQALPGGLSGNDDAGQMSAWLVFSSMGFYPVCPGTTQYIICSPVFPKVTIHLNGPPYRGETFTVIANDVSTTNRYIQSAQLNGVIWNKPWFDHSAIVEGGVLEFDMGPEPNRAWGSNSADAPFSLSQ